MKKFRRIAALIAIVLLISMYLVSLIASLSGSESAHQIFRIAFGLTLALPIVLYAFLLVVRLAKKESPDMPSPEGDLPEGPEEPSGEEEP